MNLIRVTAYVLRAVKLLKPRLKSEETELSAEKMKQAALKCCMWIQEEVYKEDYEQLKAGRTLPSSSRLLKLDPYYYKEDKVIRVGARLQFADLHEENRHQIILLHGHPAVAKVDRRCTLTDDACRSRNYTISLTTEDLAYPRTT